MDDYSDMILEDKNSGKIKQLEDDLKNVEVTYARWLNNRINSRTGEMPDKLDNYFRYFYNNTGIHFYIKDGLPIDMRNACMSVFRNIFQNN
jgi:hypothetical protein